MTEPRATGARPRPSVLPVAWLALAAFLAVLTLLAIQLRDGQDPALGSGAAARSPVRHVLLRRIIRKTVIERVIPSTGAGVSSGPASSTSAPSVSTQAPAPRPAPAPAPVTRSS